MVGGQNCQDLWEKVSDVCLSIKFCYCMLMYLPEIYIVFIKKTTESLHGFLLVKNLSICW